jgi:GNAT superfamily N-acetyltransferase
MDFDPAVSLRIVNNERLRNAQGWAEYRDLGGVLALSSDAPVDALNCLEAFTTTEAKLEGLLDIGFSLLRAFDRSPAVHLTPLDRPKSVRRHLERRGLVCSERSLGMRFAGDAAAMRTNPDLRVRRAEPDDARTFADVHSDGLAWVRRLSLPSTLFGMHEEGNTFYIGYLEGRAVGTTHLLRDGQTAGIYGVVTAKSFRRRGVASTLVAEAVRDALDAGCDVIGLRTVEVGAGARLFPSLGFAPAHETALWSSPETPG